MIKLVHILLQLIPLLLEHRFLFGQLVVLLFPVGLLSDFLDSLELLDDFVLFPLDHHSLFGYVGFLLGELLQEDSQRFLVLQDLFARFVILTLENCSFAWDR